MSYVIRKPNGTRLEVETFRELKELYGDEIVDAFFGGAFASHILRDKTRITEVK